jgi:indole-3-glycerol phosphate synthase
MALTQTVTELPKGWRNYTGIVAEVKAAAPSWVALVEDDLTPQQMSDAAAHIRKHYAAEHNLEVAVRKGVIYIRANK